MITIANTYIARRMRQHCSEAVEIGRLVGISMKKIEKEFQVSGMVWTESFGGEDNGRLEELEGKRYKMSQRGRPCTF